MAISAYGSTYSDLKGSTVPRICTEPLRDLTPDTSYGFAVVEFAKRRVLEPLDPWQEFLVIHAGELLEDGRPRFRRVLVQVARQNGKTHLLKILSLFWMFQERQKLTLAMSTSLSYALESMNNIAHAIENSDYLSGCNKKVITGNVNPHIETLFGTRYKIAAANSAGGRGLSIDRLVVDEVREHKDRVAYNAAYPAMSARPNAQAWFISNAGDDRSILLNSLRAEAIDGTDRRLGIFEWSAEDNADLLDTEAWAAANPNLGYRVDVDALAGWASRAHSVGGREAADFRTEALCQRVPALDAAVDAAAWGAGKIICENGAEALAPYADRLVLCLDMSPNGQHATLIGAAITDDKKTRLAVVAHWAGITAPQDLKKALPVWVAKLKPRLVGWFPNGPAAALTTELGKTGAAPWRRGAAIEEIKTNLASVCMGFAEKVLAGTVEHSDDPMLTTQVLAAEKATGTNSNSGTWIFRRAQGGFVDAAFAAAGAVHLVSTLPPKLPFFTANAAV